LTRHEVNAWAIKENKPLIDMAEDSILIRAERLVRGDIVLWANATWRVRLKEPVSLSEFEIVLEPVQGDDDRVKNLRTTVGRDRKFRVLLLVLVRADISTAPVATAKRQGRCHARGRCSDLRGGVSKAERHQQE
jgi:hypothetical protein